MTPNMTVNYMAIEATQQQVARRAARGWVADQAMQPRKQRTHLVGTALSRWLVICRGRTPQVAAAAPTVALVAPD